MQAQKVKVGKADLEDTLLLDVTPLSLGMDTAANPTDRPLAERELAVNHTLLGHFDLGGLPPMPRGTPQYEATFDIDADGGVNKSSANSQAQEGNRIVKAVGKRRHRCTDCDRRLGGQTMLTFLEDGIPRFYSCLACYTLQVAGG